MGKIIAAMNMTVDGFCDHTAGIADDELHEHYTELLRSSAVAIWGRIAYQLMEYWRPIAESPTGNKVTDDFVEVIDDLSKIVYSRTLTSVDWKNTELKRQLVKDEILDFKRREQRDIIVGSPSMIVQFTQLGLIDEYQLGIQPMVIGSGLTLFKNITDRLDLELLNTKPFASGVIILYYEPTRREPL
ncbi:MAG: dihydrofolate reductase family protein [Pyrinomonadaceae bacterium]